MFDFLTYILKSFDHVVENINLKKKYVGPNYENACQNGKDGDKCVRQRLNLLWLSITE